MNPDERQRDFLRHHAERMRRVDEAVAEARREIRGALTATRVVCLLAAGVALGAVLVVLAVPWWAFGIIGGIISAVAAVVLEHRTTRH